MGRFTPASALAAMALTACRNLLDHNDQGASKKAAEMRIPATYTT